MRYYVTVAGRTLDVDITDEGVVVDGVSVGAEVTTVPGTELRHLMVDGHSHALLAQQGTRRGLWDVGVGGRTLSVEAIDERTRTIREMTGGGDVEAEKVVVAPMPGLIVRVNVEVGDTVAAGQGVIVVEAMKMENELKAPADGVVSRIEVTAGAAVEKGATLIVLE